MAELSPLADDGAVVEVLRRDLTPFEEDRLAGVLSKLSALFRREARRTFAAGTTTVRLKSNGGRIHLAERPVESVDLVVDDHGRQVAWARHGQWLVTPLTSAEFATVTYSHGDGVPDEVRIAIAEAAAQIVSVDPTAVPAGVERITEAAGPFSRSTTYAAWATNGRSVLSDDDRALARSFRATVPRIHPGGHS